MDCKNQSVFIFIILSMVTLGFSQDKVIEQVTPEAINSRIDKIRKGKIEVQTKPGTEVSVKQLQHEFKFGAAVANQVVKGTQDAMSKKDREKYLEILSENFNYAVHENALKWYDCEKKQDAVDYHTADQIWDLCEERDISMRGHCIFWAKDEFNLEWLKKLDNDQLRKEVKERALDVTRHFKGRISEFDLNNEMIHGNFFTRKLGYGVINEMAYMAKAGNPDITLYLNDYGILAGGGYNKSRYIQQIEQLLANGVPIDGIGCQAHFITSDENDSYGRAAASSRELQETLNELSELGLPIKITECLFTADTKALMGEELRRVFPIFFAHPNVEAIVMWGFWAGAHWVPRTAMWNKDWSPTPQVKAYQELVFNKWWTDTSGPADSDGIYSTDAFYGDYIITSNGQEKKVTLSKEDKVIRIDFE
ncbi:MAG: endo-1,4-beta-xylanase [Candidatus Marinimicrobia bacterium]|nr:endo-1,4-beta-xylanase [Candidatus Neomarinimicrobiota bacterium]